MEISRFSDHVRMGKSPKFKSFLSNIHREAMAQNKNKNTGDSELPIITRIPTPVLPHPKKRMYLLEEPSDGKYDYMALNKSNDRLGDYSPLQVVPDCHSQPISNNPNSVCVSSGAPNNPSTTITYNDPKSLPEQNIRESVSKRRDHAWLTNQSKAYHKNTKPPSVISHKCIDIEEKCLHCNSANLKCSVERNRKNSDYCRNTIKYSKDKSYAYLPNELEHSNIRTDDPFNAPHCNDPSCLRNHEPLYFGGNSLQDNYDTTSYINNLKQQSHLNTFNRDGSIDHSRDSLDYLQDIPKLQESARDLRLPHSSRLLEDIICGVSSEPQRELPQLIPTTTTPIRPKPVLATATSRSLADHRQSIKEQQMNYFLLQGE